MQSVPHGSATHQHTARFSLPEAQSYITTNSWTRFFFNLLLVMLSHEFARYRWCFNLGLHALALTPKFYFLTFKTRTRLLPQFLLQMSKKVTKGKEVKKQQQQRRRSLHLPFCPPQPGEDFNRLQQRNQSRILNWSKPQQGGRTKDTRPIR